MLLTGEEFDRLSGERERVGDRLWARDTEHIEFELVERRAEKPPELDL